MKFIDEAEIKVKAGNGGNGVAAFRREKFVPKGGPSGGDGGEGGSVYGVVDSRLNTLLNYRYTKLYKAESGGHGSGRDRFGKNGQDLVLKFPAGTLIFEKHSGRMLADLKEDGSRVLLALGGKGGLGNIRFKSSINRTPRQFTLGEEGITKDLRLELKVLADVGLLGFPNSGKSTYIRKVSAATPKVADYPFTTLSPNLGVLDLNYFHGEIVIADVPGIIKNASSGAGMGLKFLKHIQRTRLLLHLVDVSTDNNSELHDYVKRFNYVVESIRKDVSIIEKELLNFDKRLSFKQRWIVFNKIDLLPTKTKIKLKKMFLDIYDQPVYFISGVTGEGIDMLSDDIASWFRAEGFQNELSE
ncbi:MAG: GTPase ObgE [Proteobacteria bacterium]|nr:GTPase ObgE [Pseudomonadota bacterium]